MQPDTSHLVALHESLSRNRMWRDLAENTAAREYFQRQMDYKQREIDAELKHLGMPTFDEFDAISDDELLDELGGI